MLNISSISTVWVITKALFSVSSIILPLSGCTADTPRPDVRELQKAQQADLSPLREKAYEQIAKLHVSRLTTWMNPGGFDILTIKAGSESPTQTLYKMGLDVLPVLVEALDDTTPTTVIEPERRMKGSKTWKVNELVARLITRIAQRNFVFGDLPDGALPSRATEKHPDELPQFKKVVLDWYAQNRNRSLVDRKIADVHDDLLQNRLETIEWLGKHKILKATPIITQHINELLPLKWKNSLLDAEMARSALALGQIGDKSSLPVVRQVCQQLANRLKQYGNPGSMGLDTLFQAYQGRALLGEKAEALQELKTLYEQSSIRMEPPQRYKYQNRMRKAMQW